MVMPLLPPLAAARAEGLRRSDVAVAARSTLTSTLEAIRCNWHLDE